MRRARRGPAADEDDGSPPAPTQRDRRRGDTPDEAEDLDMEDRDEYGGSGSLMHLSKGLVRYALSCEFSRKPIKRQDINEKVLGSHTRLFKDVFNQANTELMDIFGMQMVELPKAERVTARQKRSAAASESQSKSTAIWILQTILPEQYRVPEIIGPSRPLPEDEINREDSYVGLYTMVIAMITISGGMLSEGKLDRQLRRMNAEQSTPLGNKDKTLALMVKDGYIVRVKDTSSGEETIDYIVGPRGKMEVGKDGFRSFVCMICSDDDQEDLEKRIERTLQVAEAFNSSGAAAEAEPAASQAQGRKRGRPRRDNEDDE